jgi:hypothetical protein
VKKDWMTIFRALDIRQQRTVVSETMETNKRHIMISHIEEWYKIGNSKHSLVILLIWENWIVIQERPIWLEFSGKNTRKKEFTQRQNSGVQQTLLWMHITQEKTNGMHRKEQPQMIRENNNKNLHKTKSAAYSCWVDFKI